MMTTEIRFRPFANGGQYMDWQGSNCERCTKSTLDATGCYAVNCEILEALLDAACGGGTVSADIGARMGTSAGETRYVWQCGEVEWTEEWKEQYARRKGYASAEAYQRAREAKR